MTTLEALSAAMKLIKVEEAEPGLISVDAAFGEARITVTAQWWIARGWPLTERPDSRDRYVHIERKQGVLSWSACFKPEEIHRKVFQCAVCDVRDREEGAG